MPWIYTEKDQMLRLENIKYFWIEEIPHHIKGINAESYGVFCRDDDYKEWCIAEFETRLTACRYLENVFKRIKEASCESQS
jgi:hypothetical protein